MKLRGEDAINKTGNDLLIGYCKDLADMLAKDIGFTCEYECHTANGVQRSYDGGLIMLQ